MFYVNFAVYCTSNMWCFKSISAYFIITNCDFCCSGCKELKCSIRSTSNQCWMPIVYFSIADNAERDAHSIANIFRITNGFTSDIFSAVRVCIIFELLTMCRMSFQTARASISLQIADEELFTLSGDMILCDAALSCLLFSWHCFTRLCSISEMWDIFRRW